MAAKFLIVNNGMTEARGHFVETGVAVARAASVRGLEVAMGAHAHCTGDGVPNDVPLLPVFRVDHWGHVVARPRGAKARLAKVARALMPARLFDWVRAKSRARRGLPTKPWAEGGSAMPTAPRATDPDEQLRQALGAIPPDHSEYEHYRLFAADLDHFLSACGAGPGDHVYFPTAYGRDALAALALAARTGANGPTFHLEYRHALLTPAELARETDPFRAFHTRTHRAYFEACRALAPSPRVRFYTDTPELAADYAALAGFNFEVLPIPFRAELIPPAPPPSDPVRVLFLGDLRDEKGFTKLPPLVRALSTERCVQFVIPGALHSQEQSQPMQAALADLEAHPAELVARPHASGFIPAEDYYRLLAGADVVLCPYDVGAYRARSSGVFAEALAAGKPTVVPAGTWMAREQPPGAGETYTDASELLRALGRVCRDIARYRATADRARAGWRARHSPAALVAQLVSEAPCHDATRLQFAEVAR
ncbi:MAG: glycosyltransferase [Planctomycetes bacterium]|nr:glycosyltransferase [Planctomycetota bacterium]